MSERDDEPSCELLDALRASAGLAPRSARANSRMPEEMQVAVEADDARTDAQARDSEAPTAAGVLWEGHIASTLFPGSPSIERYRVRADRVNVFAHPVGEDERREYPADYPATARVAAYLARRLTAVEAELKAQVERAYREGHGDGRFGEVVADDRDVDADWNDSEARAELERATK